LLGWLRHPHIVKMIDVFAMASAAGSSAHIVLNNCGENLLTLYRRTEIDIASIVGQVLAGLQRLHYQHIVHNDIKPANIFVDSGHVRLGDFGHAFVHRSCDTTVRRGTRFYMPPESLLGQPSYGQPADIWSIGCVLAELALKMPLFQGLDESTMVEIAALI
jgi:cyclin-dependent kinase 7